MSKLLVLEEKYEKEFYTVSRKPEFIRYLKVRTLFDYECLKNYKSVIEFLREHRINIPTKIKREHAIKVMERVFFDKEISDEELNNLAKQAYVEKRKVLFGHIDINELIKDLQKVTSTNEYWEAWNSVYRDDIRQHIQHHFVRNTSIWRLEELLSRIDKDLLPVVRGYTVISWYNQWTSTLIEDLIMTHERIVPTVRKIDKVDFFIKTEDLDIPMDLKMTFIPREYIKKRKIAHPPPQSLAKVIMKNKIDLIKWLYENQGRARFSDSNRLFIVLIDEQNIEDSWKLKADIGFIEHKIYSYLNSLKELPEVTWMWNKKVYKTLSDIIFIVKKSGKTHIKTLNTFFKIIRLFLNIIIYFLL